MGARQGSGRGLRRVPWLTEYSVGTQPHRQTHQAEDSSRGGQWADPCCCCRHGRRCRRRHFALALLWLRRARLGLLLLSLLLLVRACWGLGGCAAATSGGHVGGGH